MRQSWSHDKEIKSRQWPQRQSREKHTKQWIPTNNMCSSSTYKQNYSLHDHQERYLNSDKLDFLPSLGIPLSAFTGSSDLKHMHTTKITDLKPARKHQV